MTQCTSRPECPCEFCAGLRLKHASGKSEKEELDLVLRSPKGHVKSLLELGRFEKIFNIEN